MTTAGDVAVAAAVAMVGRPYVYGATGGDTTSFDCSSLVQWAWGVAGVDLPRASIDQLQAPAPWPIDDLQPGDLVFYDNALAHGPPYRGVNHVVMWVGDGQVVEASSQAGGVRVIALAAKGRPLAVRRPGATGAGAAWRYQVRRAVGAAGRWVLDRSGAVTMVDGSPGLGGIDGRAAAVAVTPSGDGYWVAAADGRVTAFGDAGVFGETACTAAAMAATPTGLGYWVVDAAGRVAAFGDAEHCGDAASGAFPVTAMAAMPSGRGYWVVDAGGRVAAFGDAEHHGEPAGAPVPVVAMAPTPSGRGYWLADAGGKVWPFGDAAGRVGAGSDEPIVAMADRWLIDAAARVVAFEPAGVS